MDSPEAEKKKKRGFTYLFMRFLFAIIVPLFLIFSVSFTLLVIAVIVANFSIYNPISFPCQCKIVSSKVDLRSSMACELGLLNYKAKHVFYPSEKKKFRCRYDYYWASVFKVEYIDHSGQAHLAYAETPYEALPHHCRPTFGSAWLTKDKFKVNETYDCWYTFGVSKLNIYDDEFFNCQTNYPSPLEMFRRYSILSTRVLIFWYAKTGLGRYLRWEAIAGAVAGFLTALITVSICRLLLQLKSFIIRISLARIQSLAIYTVHMKRVFFLLAYFSLLGWLAIEYSKRLGLPQVVGAYL